MKILLLSGALRRFFAPNYESRNRRVERLLVIRQRFMTRLFRHSRWSFLDEHIP
jgi:hypothetical protein